MSEIKNIIPQINIREYFATPDTNGRIFTNPAQLLLNAEKLKMLGFFCDDIEKMSDYEKFSAFVSNLGQMYGSSVYQLFMAELETIFSYEGDIYEADTCELWRYICDIIESGRYLENLGLEDLPPMPLPIYSCVDAYDSLISKNLELIRSSAYDFATLDLSKTEFLRTDRYHAEQSYKAFISGEKDYIFVSGLLFEICSELKRLDKALYVYVGDNYESIKDMIGYFNERGVLPDTVIFSSGNTLYQVAKELCGSYDKNIKVCCGVVYESGDTVQSIAESLRAVARIYPIGKLVFGGSVTSSVTFSARHAIFKRAFSLAFN